MLDLGAPLHNSPRSLRSLRSNTCNEPEHEARCAREPRALVLQAAPGREARPLARHKRSTGPFVSLLAFSAAQFAPAAQRPPPCCTHRPNPARHPASGRARNWAATRVRVASQAFVFAAAFFAGALAARGSNANTTLPSFWS